MTCGLMRALGIIWFTAPPNSTVLSWNTFLPVHVGLSLTHKQDWYSADNSKDPCANFWRSQCNYLHLLANLPFSISVSSIQWDYWASLGSSSLAEVWTFLEFFSRIPGDDRAQLVFSSFVNDPSPVLCLKVIACKISYSFLITDSKRLICTFPTSWPEAEVLNHSIAY